jgi:Protein of unknown function (DUF3455)
MKNCNVPENWTTRRILLIACATALAVAFTVALPQPAHADDVTPPPVPHNIDVPKGNVAFLVGHADGTQNYICLPSGSAFAWTLVTPQATLFDDDEKQLITHFFSPNPFEVNTNPKVVADGMIRATWQDSQDTSTVWAMAIESSSNPGFVESGAIPWVLLRVVGATGGTLRPTTFIQRLNTSGGVASSQDCASSADVSKQAFVPYTADYFFYQKVE